MSQTLPLSPVLKSSLRARFRAWRSRQEPARAARHSAQICSRLEGLPEWRQARTVLLYQPVSGEVDPGALWRNAGDRLVAMPVVVDRQKPLMARVARNLAPGPYGIPEPGPEVPEVPLGSIDLVVVPGLAFDRRGARLGQGGGYYDRTLCQTGALRVAVAYSEQVVDRLHTEAHDLPMNILVTEAEVLRF